MLNKKKNLGFCIFNISLHTLLLGEKMNDNVKLLNFIYQNSQMGVETIEQLEKIVEDKDFKRYLKEKYEGYCKIHKDAKEKLNSHGYDERGIGSFEKFVLT